MNKLVDIHVSIGKKGLLLFLLHCYWLLFTLFGLVLFGLLPATNAVYELCNDEKYQEANAIKLFQSFTKSFRKNFWRMNRLGLFILPLAALFSIDLMLMRHYVFTEADTTVYLLIQLLIVISLLFLANLFWFFQHERAWKPMLKKSLILMLGKPGLTGQIFVLMVGISCCYYLLPGLFFVFGVTPLVYFQLNLFKQKDAYVFLPEKKHTTV